MRLLATTTWLTWSNRFNTFTPSLFASYKKQNSWGIVISRCIIWWNSLSSLIIAPFCELCITLYMFYVICILCMETSINIFIIVNSVDFCFFNRLNIYHRNMHIISFLVCYFVPAKCPCYGIEFDPSLYWELNLLLLPSMSLPLELGAVYFV